MKKILLFIIICNGLISCSFEEDHEKKEVVREYLKSTLHEPESLDEIQWTILKDREFKKVDSLDANSPFEIDYYATSKKPDSLNFYFIRLEYRAKNGYGAMRKSEIYAFYTEIGGRYMNFEEAAYSFDSGNFIGIESKGSMEPRLLFLKHHYLYKNSGTGTIEGFWNEYPEYR